MFVFWESEADYSGGIYVSRAEIIKHRAFSSLALVASSHLYHRVLQCLIIESL